jgi:hypothetical protein
MGIVGLMNPGSGWLVGGRAPRWAGLKPGAQFKVIPQASGLTAICALGLASACFVNGLVWLPAGSCRSTVKHSRCPVLRKDSCRLDPPDQAGFRNSEPHDFLSNHRFDWPNDRHDGGFQRMAKIGLGFAMCRRRVCHLDTAGTVVRADCLLALDRGSEPSRIWNIPVTPAQAVKQPENQLQVATGVGINGPWIKVPGWASVRPGHFTVTGTKGLVPASTGVPHHRCDMPRRAAQGMVRGRERAQGRRGDHRDALPH